MKLLLLESFLLGFILFLIGILGIILNKNNLLIMLMSIELMLLSVNLLFILYSIILDDIIGQFFALFILGVAAAETAIGLAILVSYYKQIGNLH